MTDPLRAALELDIRELAGAKPEELARRLIERGWFLAAVAAPLDTGYGWDNPAPGTRLWRLRNHPDTLSREDAVLVAQDLAARLAKERDQG